MAFLSRLSLLENEGIYQFSLQKLGNSPIAQFPLGVVTGEVYVKQLIFAL